jgi:hypothetical protein
MYFLKIIVNNNNKTTFIIWSSLLFSYYPIFFSMDNVTINNLDLSKLILI